MTTHFNQESHKVMEYKNYKITRNPKGGRGRPSLPPREKFNIQVRLECGCLSIEEVADLAGCSTKKIYYDAERGLLTLIKRGHFTRIPGPSAKKYLGLAITQ